MSILQKNIENHQILVWSRDSELREILEKNHLNYHWDNNDGNWYYPLYTNISWDKSDRYTIRSFSHSGIQQGACEVKNILTLSARHTFSWADEQATIKLHTLFKVPLEAREDLLRIQGKSQNISYVRIIVPGMATLLSPLDGSVDQDLSRDGSTQFSFRQWVKPWQSIATTIEYLTSPKNCNPAGIAIRQPGLRIE